MTKKQKLRKKKENLEGLKKTRDEDVFTLIECHVNLDLEGFEDMDPESQEPTGIKLPYIVTVEVASREVLSIRRNYQIEDPQKNKN